MKIRFLATRRSSRLVLSLGLAALSWAAAGQALAGCGVVLPGVPAPATERTSGPRMLNALYVPSNSGSLLAVGDRDTGDVPPIVGTWRFTFVSDGTGYPGSNLPPYGATVDFGTQQWHSDGTEFMISGGRAPSTGDVCMGSWVQTGHSSFKLKHMALAWTSADGTPPGPSPAAFVGPGIIRESVTVNRWGDAFAGTFTLDQYASDETTLLVHLSGTVTATRLKAD